MGLVGIALEVSEGKTWVLLFMWLFCSCSAQRELRSPEPQGCKSGWLCVDWYPNTFREAAFPSRPARWHHAGWCHRAASSFTAVAVQRTRHQSVIKSLNLICLTSAVEEEMIQGDDGLMPQWSCTKYSCSGSTYDLTESVFKEDASW